MLGRNTHVSSHADVVNNVLSVPRCLHPHLLLRFSITHCCSPPSSDDNSRKQEAEWKEKAKVELEEWHARQNEQLEKTKTNNRYKRETRSLPVYRLIKSQDLLCCKMFGYFKDSVGSSLQ